MRMGHRITLEKPADVVDTMGQPVPAWTKYRECWGDVRDEAGQELIRGEQVEGVVDASILIHYPKSGRVPKAEDRVRYLEYGTERVMEISHVRRADGRGRKLRLFVREDVE